MENLTDLDKDELLSWKEERITKMFFGGIKDKIKDLHIELGNGVALDPENPHKTQSQVSKVVGQIEALRDLIEFYTEE